MRFVKGQYFLCYAVMGSLVPYISVYFKDVQKLNETRIGYIMAAASFAMMLAPIIVTYLADAHIEPRKLAASLFLLTVASLLGLYVSSTFVAILILYAVYNLVFMPIVQLQDGMTFAFLRVRRDAGLEVDPYHRIRVWGSAG